YSTDGAPAFQRARETAAALLAAARPLDRCTLVTTSAPRTPVLHDVEGSRQSDFSATALGLPLTATHAAWPAVLEGLDQVLRSCTSPTRQVTIITDMRKSGWERGVSAIARQWNEHKVRLRIVDVGSDSTANVAFDALVPLDRTIL